MTRYETAPLSLTGTDIPVEAQCVQILEVLMGTTEMGRPKP